MKKQIRVSSVCILIALLVFTTNGGGPIAIAAPRAVASPLPLTCSGSPVPAACAYGYVYWDSTPVSGASVRIDSAYGTLNTTTASGVLSTSPYYQANLSAAPLLVSVGDTITVTATYGGNSANVTYVVASNGQQVDVFIAASELFGNGQDGDVTISSNSDLNPRRASAAGTQGSSTLTISNVTMGFSANQLVLIHQTRGTNAGVWELRRVQSATSGQLTLSTALSNNYATDAGASRAQVVWIPEYHNLTVNSGVTVSPAAWDGNTGGIVAFLSSGTVTISGIISASGKGFRGGSGRSVGQQVVASAYTGESTSGASSILNSTAANGNGGGAAYIGPTADSGAVAGGGGGGHGTAGANASGETGKAHPGLGGGTAGTADLTTMVFGGGGGGGISGDQNPTWVGYDGGAGGGVVFIGAATPTITGTITANGADGIYSTTGQAGDGGGGAGGAVLFKGMVVALGTSLVTANGGISGPEDTFRKPGGVGGVGRIRLEYYTSYTGTTDPPASTQQLAFSSIPLSTINTIYPTSISQGASSVTFRGQAGIADLSGATIASYVWRSDIDGVLSTQANFTRVASTLSVGTHNIYFKVKDSNNNWSDEVSRQLVVNSPSNINLASFDAQSDQTVSVILLLTFGVVCVISLLSGILRMMRQKRGT